MKAVTSLYPAAAVLLALLPACTGNGPTRTAGGTGAGNPAVIAMVADTGGDTALAKHRGSVRGAAKAPTANSAFLLLTDKAGHPVKITEAYVAVRQISFPSPDGDCVAPDSPLVCDGRQMALGGGWVFDLITGESRPPVAPFVLPKGTYSQVDLDLCTRCGTLPTTGVDAALAHYPIVLHGEFVYRDTLRQLDILLSPEGRRSFMSVGDIELTGGDTAHLTIELDARMWLNDVDLTWCLDQGALALEGATLTIEEGAVSGACGNCPEEIGTKIVTSGVLTRGNPKGRE